MFQLEEVACCSTACVLLLEVTESIVSVVVLLEDSVSVDVSVFGSPSLARRSISFFKLTMSLGLYNKKLSKDVLFEFCHKTKRTLPYLYEDNSIDCIKHIEHRTHGWRLNVNWRKGQFII